VSYTVVSRRDKPDIALVLGQTTAGERFIASSTEAEITGPMHDASPIGREIRVHCEDTRQIFSFVDA
jgi:hypothetical protein